MRGDTTHTESLCKLWFPLQTPDRLGIVDPLSRPFIRFEPSLFEGGDVEFINVIYRSRALYGRDEAGYQALDTG